MTQKLDNNQALHELWESTGLTQPEALALMNAGQVRGIGLSTFKAYMAQPGVERRRHCPDNILAHARKVLSKVKKAA